MPPLESFGDRRYACSLVPEIWGKIDEGVLPSTPTERNLLVHQLETVEMQGDEDPRAFFARIDSVLATLPAIAVDILEEDVVEIVLRRLPSHLYLHPTRLQPNPLAP